MSRVRPKIKSFINGGYRYNPVVDQGLINSHRECRKEYTFYLGILPMRDGGDRRAAASLIRMRARHARIELGLRVRLIRERK